MTTAAHNKRRSISIGNLVYCGHSQVNIGLVHIMCTYSTNKTHVCLPKPDPTQTIRDNPGTPRTQRCLDPGWAGVKILQRSLDWWPTVEKHRHPGPSRTQHGSTTDKHGANTNYPVPPRQRHGRSWTEPGQSRSQHGVNTIDPGPPRTVPDFSGPSRIRSISV